MCPIGNGTSDYFDIEILASSCLPIFKHIWLNLVGNEAGEPNVTEHERILQPILDLKQFAEESQYHGLIEGLGVALEAYIYEASLDVDVRTTALNALKEAV